MQTRRNRRITSCWATPRPGFTEASAVFESTSIVRPKAASALRPRRSLVWFRRTYAIARCSEMSQVRGADPAGAAYWFGQISDGSIGLGAAILAIANGAIGTDANIL